MAGGSQGQEGQGHRADRVLKSGATTALPHPPPCNKKQITGSRFPRWESGSFFLPRGIEGCLIHENGALFRKASERDYLTGRAWKQKPAMCVCDVNLAKQMPCPESAGKMLTGMSTISRSA